MANKPASPFESFDRLIRIKVLGQEVEVPDNNTLLRGFSYLRPNDIACGRFCWNAECNNSKFYFRLPGEDVERKARMCRYKPREGMEITVLSAELKFVLRGLLGGKADAGKSAGSEPTEADPPLPLAAEK